MTTKQLCSHDSVEDWMCQRCGVDMRPCPECRTEPGPDGVIRHIAGLHPAGREREIINELLDELADGLESIGKAIAKARRKMNEGAPPEQSEYITGKKFLADYAEISD